MKVGNIAKRNTCDGYRSHPDLTLREQRANGNAEDYVI